MKLKEPFGCDYCMNRKGEANHWWMKLPSIDTFIVVKWDATLAEADDVKHICSESCGTKAFAKWMAEINAPAREGVSAVLS